MFQVGDVVKWKSQAASFEKEKTGEIVAIIPIGKAPIAHSDTSRYFVTFNSVFGLDWWRTHKSMLGGGMARGHESYLIVVSPPKGSRAKKRVYWPRVKGLRK